MQMPMRAIHLGEFVAGQFNLPQTPVVTRRSSGRGVAEFVAGSFAVPQTPVVTNGSGSGMGCGCSSGCGMGDLSTDLSSTWTALQANTIAGVKAGYVVGGLFAAAIVLPMWLSSRKR